MQANKTNLTDYQYKLYSDYLDQLDGILTKYGQQTGLSIEYWHIRVDLSKNYDGIDSDNIKMQNSFKHYVYDLYHFLPTINMTPLTYQIGYDQQRQGTSNTASGSFSIYLLEKPLPGDLFRFYPFEGATDRTEIFRVTNVRYIRSSKNRLDLYQIDFETAPILVETLEHVRLNEIYCWDTERHMFLTEGPCNMMGCISDCRDKLINLINNWYDEQNGWYGLCLENSEYIVDWNNICIDPNDSECPSAIISDPPGWPPGPGWPGWPDGPTVPNPGPIPTPERNCSEGSSTKPLVFLNTILKRLKKIFGSLDIQPIWGIGTAEIPIEWIIPYYEIAGPNGPELMQRDYWDTFTCLSFQPNASSGELFNLTQILEGNCTDCPPELIQEIECHRELYTLVMALVLLLKPLLTEEQLKDKTCDRKCCNQFNPEFVARCINEATGNVPDYTDLFWDADGSNAGNNAKSYCDQYENAQCIPLYITWRDGAIWPDGGRVVG